MRFLVYLTAETLRIVFGRAAAQAPGAWSARLWVATGTAAAMLAAVFSVTHLVVRRSGRVRRKLGSWVGDAD